MKITKNIVTNLCLECYEDHYNIAIRRPRSLNESQNYVENRMSDRDYHMLKEAIRNHMLEEGFFSGIKNLLSKGKEAASSFISSFKSAPKTFKKVRQLISKDVRRMTQILPVEAEPRNASWSEVMEPLTQVVFMALGILAGSEKGFMTHFKSWKKYVNKIDKDGTWVGAGQTGFDIIFNLVDKIDQNKLDKVIEAILDGDVGDIAKGSVKVYYDVMVDLRKNLPALQRDCSRLAMKLDTAARALSKPGQKKAAYFRSPAGKEIQKLVGKLAGTLQDIQYQNM